MTNKEAIEVIKSMGIIIDGLTPGKRRNSINKALLLAIKALKNEHRIEDYKMSDSRIKKIADFYGMEPQLDILQEECAELIQAISKYRRGDSYKLTLEEIADVEIMIDQIKYLNTVAENKIIEKIKEGKLDRQIQRIIIQQEAKND